MSSGTGTPAAEPTANQRNTIVVIRDFQPGQVYTIIFITTAQAQQLPTIPPDALKIAVFPSGDS